MKNQYNALCFGLGLLFVFVLWYYGIIQINWHRQATLILVWMASLTFSFINSTVSFSKAKLSFLLRATQQTYFGYLCGHKPRWSLCFM